MPIAIRTRYRGATAHRGPSMVADTCNGHRVRISTPDANRDEEAHAIAAKTLADQYQWEGTWYGGGIKEGMVWVLGTDRQGENWNTFRVNREERET